MNKKLKILVLMGGNSSEHDVSMMSGLEVIKNLNKDKYDVSKLVIKKDGSGFNQLLKKKIDLVFIALHGKYGEDGTVQGMLDLLGIHYTGSGVLASAIGMDKEMFRKIMLAEGLPVPKSNLI